jgi:NADH-quinone oxidoreductase subunit N
MIEILPALPEIILSCAAMMILMFSVFRGEQSLPSTTALCVLALFGAGALILYMQPAGSAFNGMFAVGPFQNFVKLMVLSGSVVALAFFPAYLRHIRHARPEASVLALLAALGMMLMISSADFISLYVSLELQNLALYVLVSLRRDETRSSEAGVKYFTLGVLSSALMLFGLSYIYGFSGTTSFSGVYDSLVLAQATPLGLIFGLVFVLAGFAFKVSAAPFHAWTPDVYEGAPTSSSAFLAAVPKMAAMSLLMILLAKPLVALAGHWQPLIAILAVLSMLIGSIGGLLQTNIKRLMGYSAIVNMGTMLAGCVLLASPVAVAAVQGVLVYLAVYALGTLGVFGSLMLLGRNEAEIEEISDLGGLFHSHPAVSVVLALSLFSLAGVPPLAGFFGKYFVLLAAVQAGWTGLAVIGVLTSVIAAAYYLKVVKVMFFDEPKGLPLSEVSGRIPRGIVILLGVGVASFILSPAFLTEGARHAAESLLSQ